jgi:hypothetical protein
VLNLVGVAAQKIYKLEFKDIFSYKNLMLITGKFSENTLEIKMRDMSYWGVPHHMFYKHS